MKNTYNPWPIGKIPKELQRPELDQLKEKGYKFDDAREVISIFENKVAEFSGAKYAVAVDSCTHAIELALRYQMYRREIEAGTKVGLPLRTYVSIPMALTHLRLNVEFIDYRWHGLYQIMGTRVFDSAVLWSKGMYVGGSALQCLSFQIKKIIPIGRGGMVLTNDKEAADWIRLAAYDGRDLNTPYDSDKHVKFWGWHYYMTPEDAARGILLMDQIKTEGVSAEWENYPDVKKMMSL